MYSQRQSILQQALKAVPFEGWTDSMLARAAEAAGYPAIAAKASFPGGAMECLDQWLQETDNIMTDALPTHALDQMKLREKVFLAIKLRLDHLLPHREAVRRTVATLTLPWHAAQGIKILYRTVDVIWRSIGDTSTDFNFYTKRMMLAGIYTNTVLYWLNDHSEHQAATWEFLRRRIDDVMKIEKAKFQLREKVANWQSPFPFKRSA